MLASPRRGQLIDVEQAGVKYLCRCSFLEIYNEKIYDLLDESCAGLRM